MAEQQAPFSARSEEQGRKGADADPSACGSIRDRNIVNLVRELEQQLHARRGSPELEHRLSRAHLEEQ